MKLIYHAESKLNINQFSPFDRELITLSNRQNIRLVSPYINLSYLERLIAVSKSWQLITDLEAWILSHTYSNQRQSVCIFIKKHLKKIKHIPNIHAKILVSDEAAFVGSANFTNSGILERTEMSVSFSEQEKVEELKNWFQSLWKLAPVLTKKQLSIYLKKNENINFSDKAESIRLPTTIQKRQSRFVPLDTFFQAEKDHETELIKAIKKLNRDKIWLNQYFDMVKEILTNLDIDENSPKITMSVTKNSRMPISMGQRYILWPHHKKMTIGLILPLDFRDIIIDYPTAAIDERYFYDKKKNKEALWVEFDGDIIFSDDSFLFSQWEKAAEIELDKTKISGYRRAHNPFYYKTAMDIDYRQSILDRL